MSQLSDHNLYQDARVYALGTEELQIRKPLQWVAQQGDRSHTLSKGEQLDQIAYRYYNGKRENPERYWWLIAEVNGIDNPLDLDSLIGQSIVIPDILALEFVRKLPSNIR